MKKMKGEIDVMRVLNHPNIVRLFETFEDRKTVSLVLELCRGPSLQQALLQRGQALPEDEAAPLMKQLLDCMRYLHEQLVCHRDVKPDNMLFTQAFSSSTRFPPTGLKLADFGLACRFPRPRAPADAHRDLPLTEKVGTPEFVAPEVLHGRYDHLCDLYSCGIVMHVLLTGRHPFLSVAPPQQPSRAPDEVAMVDADCLGSLELVTPEARNLTTRLLAKRPQERITAGKALMHLWLSMDHVNTEVQDSEDAALTASCCGASPRGGEVRVVDAADLESPGRYLAAGLLWPWDCCSAHPAAVKVAGSIAQDGSTVHAQGISTI